MKYLSVLFVFALFTFATVAQDQDRNVKGKLTAHKKPQVLVMTQIQQEAASQSDVALDLDADPDEIICRKERVGSSGSSRIRVQRCRTRAEIREIARRELALNNKTAEDMKRRLSTMRSATQIRDQRTENRNRVRRRGN